MAQNIGIGRPMRPTWGRLCERRQDRLVAAHLPIRPAVSGEAAGGSSLGFTLLELTVVITIIAILVGIALPNFRAAIISAREAVLREDLFRFREAIDQYQADKGKYPESLATLVDEGYLRKLQPDPITGAADWVVVLAEPDPANPVEVPGVYDVHSASQGVSLTGTSYSEW